MIHGLINIKGYANDGTRMKQLEEHIKRTKDTYKNKNIDKTKTKENVVLMESSDTYSQRVNKIINDNDLKLQKHTNVVMAAVIKLNEKDSDTLKQNFTRDDYINFFTSQQDKFLKEYGIKKDSVLDSVIHFDETEPHLHLTFIPVVTVKDTEKDDKERELYLRKECAKKARAELKKQVSEDEFKKLPKTSVLLNIYHNKDKSKITDENKDIIYKMYDLYDKWRDIAYENDWGRTKKNAGKVTISKNELGLGGKEDFHKLQEKAYKWTLDSLNDIGKYFLCKSVVRRFYEDKKYIKDIEKFKEMNQETFIKTKEDKRLDNEIPLNIDDFATDYKLDKTFTGAYKKESVDKAMGLMKINIDCLKQSVKIIADRNKKLVNDNIELECNLNIAFKKNNEDDIKIEELENENSKLSRHIKLYKDKMSQREYILKKLEDNNDIRKHYLEKEKKADSDMEDAKNIVKTYNERTRNQDKIIEQKSQELYKDKVKKLEEFLKNKDFIGALNTFDKSSVKTEIIDKINDEYKAKQESLDKLKSDCNEQQNKLDKLNSDYDRLKKDNDQTLKNIDVYLKYYKNGEKNTQGYNIHKEIEEYKAIKQEYDDIKDELKDIKKNKYYYDTMEREHKRLKDFAIYRIKKDLDYILREHIIKEKNIELDDTKIEIYKESVDKYTRNTKYLLSSVNNTKEFEEDKLNAEDYLRIVLKNEVFSILKTDTNKKHKDISNFYKEQSQKDSEDRAELNKKVKEERKDNIKQFYQNNNDYQNDNNFDM